MSETTPGRKKFKVAKGEGLWLLSFSDLSMIFISFFILMLSYVDNKQKAQEEDRKKATEQAKQTNNMAALEKLIEEEVKKDGLEADAKVTYDVNGLQVEFKDTLLFTPGSANPHPNFDKAVGSVMNVIAQFPDRYHLVFEGHTDDTPIHGELYRSNWDLSAARGATMLTQFEKRGIPPETMSVVAHADTRPKVPIKGLTGQQLRDARAANRRVVIRIE